MFASSVGASDGSRRFVRLTVSVSVLLHVTAGIALLVVSFWKITRLTPKSQELVFSGYSQPPEGDPAPAATPSPPAPEQKPKLPDSTSPVEKKALAEQTPDPETQAEEDPSSQTTTESPGSDPGGGGGLRTDLGIWNGGPGVGVGVPEGNPDAGPPPPPEKDDPAIVEQRVIEAQRIAGTREIQLPDGVLATLRANGTTTLRVSTKLCINEKGEPATISIGGTSGYDQVEPTIRSEMSRWRYRPWVVNGKAMQACFGVTFNYRIEQ